MLVLQEDFPHLQGSFCVVDKGIDFKVVFKAAEIQVGGAYGRQHVVGDHQFGVEESFLVEVDLHTSLQHTFQVRAGG